jgi:hypothetical protein
MSPSLKNPKVFVRFQVLTAASMMFRAVFWVILPIILHGSIPQKTALNNPKVHRRVYWTVYGANIIQFTLHSLIL